MRRSFHVWFYIGAVLSVYGVMLTAAGIYQWTHLPQTVLANTHSTFWAGVFLLLVGAAYTIIYWPKSESKGLEEGQPRKESAAAPISAPPEDRER